MKFKPGQLIYRLEGSVTIGHEIDLIKSSEITYVKLVSNGIEYRDSNFVSYIYNDIPKDCHIFPTGYPYTYAVELKGNTEDQAKKFIENLVDRYVEIEFSINCDDSDEYVDQHINIKDIDMNHFRDAVDSILYDRQHVRDIYPTECLTFKEAQTLLKEKLDLTSFSKYNKPTVEVLIPDGNHIVKELVTTVTVKCGNLIYSTNTGREINPNDIGKTWFLPEE